MLVCRNNQAYTYLNLDYGSMGRERAPDPVASPRGLELLVALLEKWQVENQKSLVSPSTLPKSKSRAACCRVQRG